MLFIPLLAGKSDNIALSLLLMAVKGIGVIFLKFLSSKYLIPSLLFRIAKTRNEELLLAFQKEVETI